MGRLKKSIIPLLIICILIIASFSILAKQPREIKIEIDTLVIPCRKHTRMQPEIQYALKTSAKKSNPVLKMRFVLFNPFQDDVIEDSQELEEEFIDFLDKSVAEVVKIKKANTREYNIVKYILDYVEKKPESSLAKVYEEIEEIMEDFEFLVIESTETSIHPIFYKADVTTVGTSQDSSANDIIETLYGLFFIDVAVKENKPIWGTCHGAQLGYLYAGGKLERLFDYKEGGYDLDFKKSVQNSSGEEIWHIDTMLYTQKKDSEYIEYSLVVCPVPEIFKDRKKRGREIYLNKDLAHIIAMVDPIPEDLEVISYHPLSEYKDEVAEGKYEDFNKEFKKVLKNQVIIDAYRYKTMLGTQYHPHYTYDDLQTSIVFEYLVEEIANRYKK